MSALPKSRRWYQVLVPLLLLALFAASCGDDGDSGSDAGNDGTTTAPESTDPVTGGSATILLFSEIGTLDPVKATGSGGSDGQRFFPLYGGLVVFESETGEAEPLLAESFEPDATFTTWTLKLKPGITFSDGTAYDATAVKTTWEKMKDVTHRSPSLTTLMPVTQMVVTDPTTLTITLAAPNAHFDKAIARVGANYITSAKAIQEGKDLTSEAVGAGPFTLASWTRDDRMVLKKNPNWKGGEGPYFDEIILRTVSDEDQRIDTFNTGQADGFYTATPSSVARAQDGVDGATYTSVAVLTGQTYVFNTTKPPFNDPRVRKAFIQGVDWQAMAETVFGEGAEAPDNFTLESSPWYTPGASLPEYDPKAAQELINSYNADNGGGPLTVSMLAFQQTLDQARAKFIQTSLDQLDNINIDVQVNDSPTNIGKVLALDYMVSSWGFPHVEPEPGLYTAAYSKSFNNYSKYNNPAVDAALDEGRGSTDAAKRKELYGSVYEALSQDLPYYPYLKTVNGFVLQPNIKGGAVYEDGILRFDLLWRAK